MKSVFSASLLLSCGLAASVAMPMACVAGDSDPLERGRYLVQISGCNDCHTPGWFMNGGTTPEDQWLTGDGLGWRGGWGTTYASNLRLFMQGLTEDQWVEAARTLQRRPPMPWFTLNRMHEDDLRAIYRFTRALGDPGQPAPAWLPPGEEPQTPFVLFPEPPQQQAAAGN